MKSNFHCLFQKEVRQTMEVSHSSLRCCSTPNSSALLPYLGNDTKHVKMYNEIKYLLYKKHNALRNLQMST